jgi:DNA-binding MarR family transcriptional regulator
MPANRSHALAPGEASSCPSIPSIAEELALGLGPHGTLLPTLPFGAPPQRGLGRLAILELVQTRPGMHKMAICRATGLAWGTVTYHLDGLAAEGRVHELRDGKETYVFPSDVPVAHRRWLTVLQAETSDRVICLVAHNRETSVSEVMERLQVSRKPAQRVLDRLEEAGLLVRLGRGRARYTLGAAWASVAPYAKVYGLHWALGLRASKVAANTPAGPMLVQSPHFFAPVAAFL